MQCKVPIGEDSGNALADMTRWLVQILRSGVLHMNNFAGPQCKAMKRRWVTQTQRTAVTPKEVPKAEDCPAGSGDTGRETKTRKDDV
jgi:Tfp pilus assembly protein PilN